MLKTLRIKIVCIMMAVVTVMLCVIFGMMLHFTRRNLDQESDAALHTALSEPGFIREPHEISSTLPYLVMRLDARGSLQISGTIYFERYSAEELQKLWNLACRSDGKPGILGKHDLKYLRVSDPMGIRCVFVDISSHNMVMNSLTGVSIFVGLLSFVLLLGASIFFAWWCVKPVEKAWQQQRQFVADASHELKTPLTVIMTNAELLQNSACGQAEQQYISGIQTMSVHMRKLVEGLLELARVDNGAVKASFAPLNLSKLVSDGLLHFEPLCFERRLVLSSEIDEDIQCNGSETHLRQVLEILLDNAMKYSTSGGEIRVTLRRQGSHCTLSVANPGDSISPEDLKNIFKRFYRIDKARSRDGSYGLGLSIAQSIASDHRGKIWAESSGGINTFYVQLNAQKSPIQ